MNKAYGQQGCDPEVDARGMGTCITLGAAIIDLPMQTRLTG